MIRSLGPTFPSGPVLKVAQDLKAQGVDLRETRSIMDKRLSPEAFVQRMREGSYRLKADGRRIDYLADLAVMGARHGIGSVSGLPNGFAALALVKLEKSGFSLNRWGAGVPLQEGLAMLEHDANGLEVRGPQGQKADLRTPEDLCAARYFFVDQVTDGLSQPEKAESLLALQQGGAVLWQRGAPIDPVQAYHGTGRVYAGTGTDPLVELGPDQAAWSSQWNQAESAYQGLMSQGADDYQAARAVAVFQELPEDRHELASWALQQTGSVSWAKQAAEKLEPGALESLRLLREKNVKPEVAAAALAGPLFEGETQAQRAESFLKLHELVPGNAAIFQSLRARAAELPEPQRIVAQAVQFAQMRYPYAEAVADRVDAFLNVQGIDQPAWASQNALHTLDRTRHLGEPLAGLARLYAKVHQACPNAKEWEFNGVDKGVMEAVSAWRKNPADEALFLRHVAHFRTHGHAAEYWDRLMVGGPEGLSERLDAYEKLCAMDRGYHDYGYAALESVLAVRQPGQSLEPLMQLYQEVLKRGKFADNEQVQQDFRAIASLDDPSREAFLDLAGESLSDATEMLEKVNEKAPDGQRLAWLQALGTLKAQAKKLDLTGLNQHRALFQEHGRTLCSLQPSRSSNTWHTEQLENMLEVARLAPAGTPAERVEKLEKLVQSLSHHSAADFTRKLGDRPDAMRWVDHLNGSQDRWDAHKALNGLLKENLEQAHELIEGLGIQPSADLVKSVSGKADTATWVKNVLAQDDPKEAALSVRAVAEDLPEGLAFEPTADLLLQVPARGVDFLLGKLAQVPPEKRPAVLGFLTERLRRLGTDTFIQGWHDSFMIQVPGQELRSGSLEETSRGVKLGGVMLRKRS